MTEDYSRLTALLDVRGFAPTVELYCAGMAGDQAGFELVLQETSLVDLFGGFAALVSYLGGAFGSNQDLIDHLRALVALVLELRVTGGLEPGDTA